jgi:hypothetical protein
VADIIDQAQAFDALNLAQALEVRAAIAKNTQRPQSRGCCLNIDCEEPFSDPARLFCGPPCAEAYDRRASRR